jgi:phospholipid transport system transporter-binding protein
MSFLLPDCVNQKNALTVQEEGARGLLTNPTIDCAALHDFDSSVLAVLMAWQRQLGTTHQSLRVLNPPAKLKVLAGVYGVADLLGLN